jgi:hypothetical protein
MPKKKTQESQAEQSARFLEKVRELEAAGKLSPTEAARRMEITFGALKSKRVRKKPGR